MRVARKLLESVIVLAALAAVAVVWCCPVSLVFFKGVMPLRLWHQGGKSQWVTVSGMSLHYDVLGPVSGTPVVLVHGLGGRAEEWLDLAPALTKAGYRVYLPDLPGYGQSDKPADFSYSVADEAEVVAGFLSALNLKQVDLGGISMGGAIVQHVAFEHPEQVKQLMLFDAAGIDEKPDWDTQLFTPESVFEVRELNVLLYSNPRQVPEFVAQDIVRLTGKNGWVIKRALASMLTGKDATDALLPQLKMPVLIVWGAEDKILPLHQGDKMHSLVPQSEFEVFPGCGHLTPYQCANQVSPYVVRFLQK